MSAYSYPRIKGWRDTYEAAYALGEWAAKGESE